MSIHPNWRTHIFQRGRYTTSQFLFIRVNSTAFFSSWLYPMGSFVCSVFLRMCLYVDRSQDTPFHLLSTCPPLNVVKFAWGIPAKFRSKPWSQDFCQSNDQFGMLTSKLGLTANWEWCVFFRPPCEFLVQNLLPGPRTPLILLFLRYSSTKLLGIYLTVTLLIDASRQVANLKM